MPALAIKNQEVPSLKQPSSRKSSINTRRLPGTNLRMAELEYFGIADQP